MIISAVKAIVAELRDISLPARWTAVGAASAGAIGGIAGLAIGLSAYAPTAWFAVFELGIPAAIVGGIVGLLAALVVLAGGRIKGG